MTTPGSAATVNCEDRSESGTTLVELVIAVGIMSVLVAGAATALTTLTNQSTIMQRQDQGISVLQVAEQKIVREIHAVASWCQTPTVNELKFVSDLPGSPAYDIQMTGGQLVQATGSGWTAAQMANCSGAFGSAAPLVTQLDAASSFSIGAAKAWTGISGQTYSYYDFIGVVLTMDSPGPANTKVIMTTVADPSVEAWEVKYSCETAWAGDPAAGGTDPC